MSKYLFNGVELPALPSVDKNTFPCATIIPTYTMVGLNYVFNGYALYFTTADVFEVTSGGVLRTKDGDLRAIYYKCEGDEWAGSGSVITLSTAFSGEGATWTNYELLYMDGSVYLPASDPKPIPPESYASYLRAGTWQKNGYYARENGAWVKQTAYRRESGVWVKVKEK